MLDSASIGAFLNITSGDPEAWESDLAALEDTHVEHLELWLEYLPTSRQLNTLASLLRGRRTIMHGPFIGLSLATSWDALATISLDRCHGAVELAGVLGCEVVTIHAGAYGNFEPHQGSIARLADRFARFSRIPHPLVTVENMPVRGGATSEALATVADLESLRALLPDVRFTLDVGHCLQNGEDPSDVFAALDGSVANVHLHDGSRNGNAHNALGTGELDLARLLSTLDERSYQGFVTLETLSPDDLRRSLSALGSAGIDLDRRLDHAV